MTQSTPKSRPQATGNPRTCAHLVFESNLLWSWHSSLLNYVVVHKDPFVAPQGTTWVGITGEIPATEELRSQIEKSFALEEAIFNAISNKLNEIHNVKLPARSWRILTGHWLRSLCQNVVRRESQLSLLKTDGRAISVTGLPHSRGLIPDHTGDAYQLMEKSEWSHFIFLKIFRDMHLGTIVGSCDQRLEKVDSEIASTQKMKTQLDDEDDFGFPGPSVFPKTLSRFFTSAGVMTSTYLPRRVQLAVAVFVARPTIWVRPGRSRPLERPANIQLRQVIANEGTTLFGSPEAALAWELFWLLCPKSFLEGFQEVRGTSRACAFPETPSFVLTGTGFDGKDDILRVHLALATARKTRFVVNQHGANYGTSFLRGVTVEEETSDFFITWGWTREKNFGTYLPLGRCAFPTGNRKNRASGAFFVLDSPLSSAGLLEPWRWNYFFYRRQSEALRHVSKEILRDSTLRFHRDQLKRWPEQRELWATAFPDLSQDDGYHPIHRLIPNHRISVFLYDSTGFLEGLQTAHPTVAFFPEGLEHIAGEFMGAYEDMVQEGLIFVDGKALAAFLLENWEGMQQWWSAKRGQLVVRQFTNRLALTKRSIARQIAYVARR